MKVVAISILRFNPDVTEPVTLVQAFELSSVGFFLRGSAREMLTFLTKTIAKRTPPGQRQSVQQDEHYVHVYMRSDGLCGCVTCDAEYPARVAFSVLTKVLEDFDAANRWGFSGPVVFVWGSRYGTTMIPKSLVFFPLASLPTPLLSGWKTEKRSEAISWPPLEEQLRRYQDPANADQIMRIQKYVAPPASSPWERCSDNLPLLGLLLVSVPSVSVLMCPRGCPRCVVETSTRHETCSTTPSTACCNAGKSSKTSWNAAASSARSRSCFTSKRRKPTAAARSYSEKKMITTLHPYIHVHY